MHVIITKWKAICNNTDHKSPLPAKTW